jgi:hypothetical protein
MAPIESMLPLVEFGVPTPTAPLKSEFPATVKSALGVLVLMPTFPAFVTTIFAALVEDPMMNIGALPMLAVGLIEKNPPGVEVPNPLNCDVDVATTAPT